MNTDKKTEALKLAQIAMRGVWAVGLTGNNVMSFEEAMKCVEESLADQQQQDPVGYMNQNGVIHPADYEWEGTGNILTPLYTSPQPSKPWVGLTEEERQACTQSPFTAENYLAIEAKLKEKNGF